jgi:ribosomal protein S18 acetylase RimI-like enzyme
MSDVLIRPARPEEFSAIGALSVAAYRDTGQANDHYVPILADVASRATAGTVLAAVDSVDGTVLGSVLFVLPGSRFAELSREGEAEFRTLAVAPEAQGRGVGEALARACLERAAELGCRAVVICARDIAKSAQRLYARIGFLRTPERDWSPVPGVHLLALRLDLAQPAVN